jgi:hypothetical protein
MRGRRARIMLVMTSAPLTENRHRPPASTSPPGARRLVLVPASPRSGRDDELVRRYRMARLRLEPRELRGEERFAHLKQFHD